MKMLRLLIITSILTFAAARVVGPQLVDSRKNAKLQSKQEDDEGVDVDPLSLSVSNIQVYEVTTASTTASIEENSVELASSTSSEATSTSTETESNVVNEDDANPINRYCKCTSYECDCCRDFSLPLVPIRGPGCAHIRYLEGDRMSIGIKFGDRVLANRIISGRKETPVCLPLPGGFTNFCGRIYGISKKNEDFKACLGLELRADEEVEAALRVSCFSFGPRGLKVMEAEPIPVAQAAEEEDDDDDDLFGLGGSDDDEDDDVLDDDDDEDDTPVGQSAGNVGNNSDDDDDDDTDYTGLSLLSGDLFDDILGDDDSSQKPSRKQPNRRIKGSGKLPGDSELENQNEVDGIFEETKPSNDDDDDDDDEDEDESGGILGILDDLISDDDDEEEDEDEKVEDEVSEEIAENELEDDAEDVVEETDETSPVSSEKDNEIENENDLDEQELAAAVADDDDDIEDDDDDEDDELGSGKPSTYAGLSLLGLRNFFSRFFH